MEALRKCTRVAALLIAIFAFAAPSAHALDPPQVAVGGPNSKWISGDLLQQTGLNCATAILGEPYTEVMVSGIASYGGLTTVPHVGDKYWTAFLVSIPGNPCGSGSSSVVTSLVMPPHTQVDSSRQIRCFGLGRSAGATWQEITNQSWSFLNQSGPYCPSQPTTSPYHPGGLQFGFRPLANGQLFWIFVPVQSDAQLVGAGHSPPDGFYWLTDATGVYANPGLSTVWANVFPGAGGDNPVVYFGRNPTVIPFWNDAAPDGQKNSAEWFANLYSAGRTGNLCFNLYAGSNTSAPLDQTCAVLGSLWKGAIPNLTVCPAVCLNDLWQVEGGGPNGGFTPFYYGNNETYTIEWVFTHDGPGSPAKATTTFTTLNGADPDHDGVGAVDDSCPDMKGTLGNGCNVATQADPDKDGVYGDADKCPNTGGDGSLNGCPGGIIPEPLNPDVLTGILRGVKSGALLKKQTLAKGLTVKYTCTVDSAAKAALTITKKTAAKIKIKTKKKNVTIASGKGRCSKASGGSLKLKLARAYAKKVKRARKKFPATLAVNLTAANQTPVTMKRPVKVG